MMTRMEEFETYNVYMPEGMPCEDCGEVMHDVFVPVLRKDGSDKKVCEACADEITSYRGYSYEIVSEGESHFSHGMRLYIEGERIMSADELEKKGFTGPWDEALEQYAKAFIDGQHFPDDIGSI